jgi:hypothetical protein
MADGAAPPASISQRLNFPSRGSIPQCCKFLSDLSAARAAINVLGNATAAFDDAKFDINFRDFVSAPGRDEPRSAGAARCFAGHKRKLPTTKRALRAHTLHSELIDSAKYLP